MTASPVDGEALLSLAGVSKNFGALTAVKDLSFEVAAGEVLGIGGPNGAGKTTLFEVISGLNPATSGTIRFDGRDITRLGPEAVCHAGIARTFQLNASFESLSVRDNVRIAAYFGRRNRGWPGMRLGSDIEALTDGALDLVGYRGSGDAIAGDLPVLDRKLLMLAGAMATAPKLLLMDEPVGGLTARETDHMMEVVRAIAATGVTIILIEHVMRFLVQLSDRVMILHHGTKIFEGDPASLAYDQTVVDIYLGEGASARMRAAQGEQRP
jgi:branched-chain amino acid transport system ATP-binding protein